MERLTNLEVLLLYNNEITKIEDLQNLTSLKLLALNNNKISKIEELESLTNLEELYLTDNQIETIEGLEALTHLKVLFLGGNQIKKFSNIEHLSALESLDLGANQIEEIKGLEQFPNLKQLSLSYNPIKKVEGLHALQNLHDFDIDRDKLSKKDQEIVEEIGNQAWRNKQEEIERIEKNRKVKKRREKKKLLKIKNIKRIDKNLTSKKIKRLRKKAIARITRRPYIKSHWTDTNRYLDCLIKDKLLDSPLFKFDPRYFRKSLYQAYFSLRTYYWGSFYGSFLESSRISFTNIYFPTKEIAIYLRLLNFLIHCIEERGCNPSYTNAVFKPPPQFLSTIPSFSSLAPFEKVREYIDFISNNAGKSINWFFDDLLGEDADKRIEMNPRMLVPIPLCFYTEVSHLRDKLIELIGENPAKHEEFRDPQGILWYKPAFVEFLDSPDFCGKLLPYLTKFMTSVVANFTNPEDMEDVEQLTKLFSALFSVLATAKIKAYERAVLNYDSLKSQLAELGLQKNQLEKLIRRVSPNNSQLTDLSLKGLFYWSAKLYEIPLILDESRNRIYTSVLLLYDSFLTIFSGKLQKTNYELRGQMAENYIAYYIIRFFKDKMVEELDRHIELSKSITEGFQKNLGSFESLMAGNSQNTENELKERFSDLFDDSGKPYDYVAQESRKYISSMEEWQRTIIQYYKDMEPQLELLKTNAHNYLKVRPFKLILYSTDPQKLADSNYSEMKSVANAFKYTTYSIPIDDNELKGFNGAKEFDVCCIIGNTLLIVEVKDHLFREMYNVPHIAYLTQLKLIEFMKNLENWFRVPTVKQKIETAIIGTYSEVKTAIITQMPFFQFQGESDLTAFSILLLKIAYETQHGKNSSDEKVFLHFPTFPDYPKEWINEEELK